MSCCVQLQGLSPLPRLSLSFASIPRVVTRGYHLSHLRCYRKRRQVYGLHMSSPNTRTYAHGLTISVSGLRRSVTHTNAVAESDQRLYRLKESE